MTVTTGGSTPTTIYGLGPQSVALTSQQCRRVLVDLANLVYGDRERNDPIYTDDVLLQLIPPFCGDIDPQLAVALFLLLAEEEHEAARGDTTYPQIKLAETNARNYLDTLLVDAA